jgi:hypothetical protein
VSTESNRRKRLKFGRKIDGKRHIVREFMCLFGWHSESAFAEGQTYRWCWYCGEDL